MEIPPRACRQVTSGVAPSCERPSPLCAPSPLPAPCWYPVRESNQGDGGRSVGTRQPGAMSVVMTTSTGTGEGAGDRRRERPVPAAGRRTMETPVPPQGNRIRLWRVTPQAAKANRACCNRCKGTFEAGELRLQAVRDNEIAPGNRNTSRYFHPHCVDAMLPAARSITGFDALPEAGRQTCS